LKLLGFVEFKISSRLKAESSKVKELSILEDKGDYIL